MITASEYEVKKNELLTRYESRVRSWLKENDPHGIADKIPFFRDGITCPDIWFAPKNDFRPLFILKEVSLGVDNINKLDKYLETWGKQKTFEFIENPFDDVKIGSFTLWKKIAALAKGLEDVHYGMDYPVYDINKFAYVEGGEKYTGTIEGYKKYNARTANQSYNDMINKIAILEIKKIGGGRSVDCELSKATKRYSEHIEPFKDLICEQIKIIDPTVIVCCSREFLTGNLLKEIENNTGDRYWIYGYHPTMNTLENFYNKTLETYKTMIE